MRDALSLLVYACLTVVALVLMYALLLLVLYTLDRPRTKEPPRKDRRRD